MHECTLAGINTFLLPRRLLNLPRSHNGLFFCKSPLRLMHYGLSLRAPSPTKSQAQSSAGSQSQPRRVSLRVFQPAFVSSHSHSERGVVDSHWTQISLLCLSFGVQCLHPRLLERAALTVALAKTSEIKSPEHISFLATVCQLSPT